MLTSDPTDRIAYRIAKVISAKVMANDRHFARMDGLMQVSAIHTMALKMVPDLLDEAAAAWAEAQAIFDPAGADVG